jgi:NTE family protein
LNTPIKPALTFGAKRVIVIGLSSTAPPARPEPQRPDVFAGAGQFIQALLADPVAQDVATLASRNQANPEDRIPYIFVSPRDRLTIGELARETFRTHLSGIKAMIRARDLTTLGTILGAGKSATQGELFSYLFFATEFHKALIELGRRDALRWLELTHDEGPWRLGPPPAPPPTQRTARSKRQPSATIPSPTTVTR